MYNTIFPIIGNVKIKRMARIVKSRITTMMALTSMIIRVTVIVRVGPGGTIIIGAFRSVVISEEFSIWGKFSMGRFGKVLIVETLLVPSAALETIIVIT